MDGQQYQSIIDVLVYRAAESPGQVVYTYLKDGEVPEADLTYAELDSRSQIIASGLSALQVTGPLLLLYPSGLEFISAFLGCLRAGIIAIPIKPPHPRRSPESLSAIVRDSGATAALAPATTIERLKRIDFRITWINADELLSNSRPSSCCSQIQQHDIAYLQYTSGSLAQPKGVMISHANILHNLNYIDEDFWHSDRSTSVSWLPHFHDMGLVYGLLEPLYKGFRCILMSPGSFLKKPERWLRAISNFKATHSGGPDFAYELCASRVDPEQKQNLTLATWEIAFTGAELVRQVTLNRFSDAFARCGFNPRAFRPAYGLAEATLKVTCHDGRDSVQSVRVDARALEHHNVRCAAGEACSRVVVACGIPKCGMSVLTVRVGSLVPCQGGEVGEVWVSGPSVAQGYWHRPVETSNTFAARVASEDRNYLRTGDLGFIHSSQLFIVGRLKDTIVIRGRNFNAEDIENTVKTADPYLQAMCCAAFSVESECGEAFAVVVESGAAVWEACAEADCEEIARNIRDAIAAQHGVQPLAVVLVPVGTVPKTSSGKVKRNTCRDLYLSRALDVYLPIHAAPPIVDMASAGEFDSLSLIIADILKCKPQQLEETRSLTSQGLDSLRAAELVATLKKKWGCDYQSSDLLNAVTVQDLRKVLPRVTVDQQTTKLREDRNTELSCQLSYEQERVFLLHERAPSKSSFNIMTGLRLQGALKRDRIEQCMRDLIDRHVTLRSRFGRSAEGDLEHIVVPTGELTFAMSVGRIEAEQLANEMEKERRQAFDISRPPLLRATLLEITERDFVLLLTAHHIVSDAISLSILGSEFAELYGREIPFSLPDLPVTFRDFVSTERALLSQRPRPADLEYWRHHLAGSPERHPWHPGSLPDADSLSIAYQFDVSEVLVIRLQDRCRELDLTPFMWLFALFAYGIFELTKVNDVVISVPVSGRTPQMNRIVGFFAHPLPVRILVPDGASFQQVLQASRQALIGAFTHQNVPTSKILDVTRQVRHSKGRALFHTAITLISQPEGFFHSPEVTIGWAQAPMGTDDMLVSLTFVDHGNHWSAEVRSAENTLSNDQLKDFADRLMRNLQTSLQDFNSMQPVATSTESVPVYQIVVASTFRAEPARQLLQFWMKKLGVCSVIRFLAYNQVLQELLRPEGLLLNNKQGLNILFVRFEDWDKQARLAGTREVLARAHGEEFLTALRMASERSVVPYIIAVCPPSPAYLQELGGELEYEQLECQVVTQAEAMAGVHVVRGRELASFYPKLDYYDGFSDAYGDAPFTPELYAALTSLVARRYHAITRPPRKLILLDCDYTLWTGSCGEDGPAAVQIDDGRVALQRFMAKCAHLGMLLCLCSKNYERDVMKVFESRPEMVLTLDQITSWRINWDSKADNVRSISEELNIALRDMIFVDDNPAECLQMREQCPDVLTVQLPTDSSRLPQFLDHIWAFDIVKPTPEDSDRVLFYRQNANCKEMRKACPTVDDFLRALDLKIRMGRPAAEQIERVAKLAQRANQFNTSPSKHTVSDVKALLRSGYDCLVVEAGDRFGTYGLIGVVIYSVRQRVLDVPIFLLSCRVLGKGIESRMLENLLREARRQDLSYVDIHFSATGRNHAAQRFFNEVQPDSVDSTELKTLFRFRAQRENIANVIQ